MKEFTLKIFYSNYYGNYDEFYDYLYSLNGMDNVSLTSFDEYLIIDVFYDEKIILIVMQKRKL